MMGMIADAPGEEGAAATNQAFSSAADPEAWSCVD